MIEEIEFAQRIGTTVKLHLKEEDGSFKNHYHRYKTEEKAEHMYQIFRKAIGEKQTMKIKYGKLKTPSGFV